MSVTSDLMTGASRPSVMVADRQTIIPSLILLIRTAFYRLGRGDVLIQRCDAYGEPMQPVTLA